MSAVGRLAKICVLIVLGAAATGCVVLPFGYGHGRHGRGHHHYAPHSAERLPIMNETPRGVPGQGRRQ